LTLREALDYKLPQLAALRVARLLSITSMALGLN
jgi:hypothetical protein